MPRTNRIPLTLAALSACIAGHAYAVGLGEITVHSSLNQPLSADIELLQVGNLTTDELIARLANDAAFERAGVERFVFLNDLHFTPVIRGGRGYIRVVSNRPVHEPYLNFVLEVERPNGRLMREYTVLLDPPGYGPRTMATHFDSDERAVPAARPTVTRTSVARAAPPRAPAAAGDGRYTTVRNDTLWKIATRLGASGNAREALMADIHQLNPQAFINGDIHRLKVGETLILPAGKQAPAAAPAPAPAPVEAPKVAESAPAAPAAADSVQQAKEELAGLASERQRLNERLDSLEQQLGSMQKSLEDRDQQIQALQEELSRRQASAPAAQPAPAIPAAQQQPAPVVQAPATAQPAVAANGPGDPLNWRWLTLGGLLALIGGLLLARRRHTDKPDDAPQAVTAVQVAPKADELPEPKVQPVVKQAAPRKPAALVVDASVAKLPSASADGLEGASIYIAYGRFGHARDLLRESIELQPKRCDLRLKLMTVLGELGDVEGFRAQEQELIAMGCERRQIDQVKDCYPAMMRPAGEQLLPSSEALPDWDDVRLDDIPAAPVARADAAPALDIDDSWDLDLDWDNLENPLDNPLVTRKAGKSKADEEADLMEEFRSNLYELPEVTEFDLSSDATDEFLNDLQDGSGHDQLLASLDQARRCIDNGKLDEAYRILRSIIENGNSREKAEARELLAKIA